MLPSSTTRSVAPEVELAAHPLGVLTGVLQPAVRERREIGVLDEDLLRRDVGGQLDQEAPIADIRTQRVERLHAIEILGPEEALAQRADSQVDDDVAQRRGTKAAGLRHGSSDSGERIAGDALPTRQVRSSSVQTTYQPPRRMDRAVKDF